MTTNRIALLSALMILGACCRFATWAGALEVSLEENKVQKGGIGYVDMHLLFKMFPETQKAKLSFEDALHQTEEQINLRRAEIIGLRADIARLQTEKDFILKTSSPTAPSAPITDILPAPALDVSHSTAPTASQSFRRHPDASGVSVSSGTIPASSGALTIPPAPPITAKVSDIDRNIADKKKSLEAKEADFKNFEAVAEKSLLDLEGHKTEILLGRIYKAIQEVAKNEGVSVVMDKSQILFGHEAVDLTDKVLQKLKSQ